MSTAPKPGNPYYLSPRRAIRLTDPFAGRGVSPPCVQLSGRARLKRSLALILLTTLRLLVILAVPGALIGASVLLGMFAFDSAQADTVALTPTATPAPSRTPVPTLTPTPIRTPTPSPTQRPRAISLGQGLAYIWKPKPVLSGAEGQVDTFDNVFSCAICGDGKPDKREYFVCATGYEATRKGWELGALERVPGWDNPGVCVVGVWGATFKRMAIAISADVAMALAVTPGKVPEIEIYTNNIPEGYLLMRSAGSEEENDERISLER